MKLSDVMSAAGLAGYAQMALILFLIVFVAVGASIVFAKRSTMEHAARLPLDDDSFVTPHNSNERGNEHNGN